MLQRRRGGERDTEVDFIDTLRADELSSCPVLVTVSGLFLWTGCPGGTTTADRQKIIVFSNKLKGDPPPFSSSSSFTRLHGPWAIHPYGCCIISISRKMVFPSFSASVSIFKRVKPQNPLPPLRVSVPLPLISVNWRKWTNGKVNSPPRNVS